MCSCQAARRVKVRVLAVSRRSGAVLRTLFLVTSFLAQLQLVLLCGDMLLYNSHGQ